jgi:hypothetical protein
MMVSPEIIAASRLPGIVLRMDKASPFEQTEACARYGQPEIL